MTFSRRVEADLSFSAGSLPVIVDLIEQTAASRFERPVDRTGRSARISAGREILAAFPGGVVNDREVALYQKDLLPIVVHKPPRRDPARPKAEQPGTAPAAPLLVETARQDLLLDTVRIARWRRPARIHVDTMK